MQCCVVPRLLLIINDRVNGHSSSSSAQSLSPPLLIFLSFSLMTPLCFHRHRFTSVVLAEGVITGSFISLNFFLHFVGKTTSGKDNKASLQHESQSKKLHYD